MLQSLLSDVWVVFPVIQNAFTFFKIRNTPECILLFSPQRSGLHKSGSQVGCPFNIKFKQRSGNIRSGKNFYIFWYRICQLVIPRVTLLMQKDARGNPKKDNQNKRRKNRNVA